MTYSPTHITNPDELDALIGVINKYATATGKDFIRPADVMAEAAVAIQAVKDKPCPSSR
jgi:hypothetical protein